VVTVTLLLRRLALEPLRDISQAMRRFGSGRKRTRAPEHGPAELRDMARTFNEMANSLAHQQEQQLAFLAGVAHELRNPLSALKLSTALSDRPGTPLTPERTQRTLALVRRQVDRLDRMVGDLLDASRIEAGKLELRIEPINIQGLMDQVMDLMSPLARNKRLMLRQQGRLAETILVHGDVLRMRQIALNLIGNAIKFTEHGDVVVEMGVVEGGKGFWMDVVDTGPGMSEAQQKRLFQRFEQADGALTTHRYGGSGLGLAISQELAAAMGGQIQVRSRLGEGSTFRVELPLQWVQMAVLAPLAEKDERPLQILQILLVEDDPTIAEVICGLLSDRGHVVVHAAHGLSALAELVGAPFDIALLDLDLPGMDGIALAAQIRQLGLRLPLLAVTARADAEARVLVEAAGFQGFLRKPVTGQMLMTAIEQAMAESDRTSVRPSQSVADGVSEAETV